MFLLRVNFVNLILPLFLPSEFPPNDSMKAENENGNDEKQEQHYEDYRQIGEMELDRLNARVGRRIVSESRSKIQLTN